MERKRTINAMCLNHLQTIPPPWSTGKLSSVKPVSGTKKVGDHCLRLYVVVKSSRGQKSKDLCSKPSCPSQRWTRVTFAVHHWDSAMGSAGPGHQASRPNLWSCDLGRQCPEAWLSPDAPGICLVPGIQHLWIPPLPAFQFPHL